MTNPQGVIDTETMYATFMQGTLAPKGSDWKTNYHTWDGHIAMVNPKEYSKKPQVLPNGKTTSASALKAYADKNFKYSRQTANAKYASSAPKIDGEKDAIYKNSTDRKSTRLNSSH